MQSVRRSVLVPHAPLQMYTIVNDVRRYPEFVPWCPATRVHEETADSIWASVDIERSGVRFSLTTRNRMVPGERIDLGYVDGPLRTLEGSWEFRPILERDDAGGEGRLRGCRVELDVRFAFASAALTKLFGPVFEASWDSLVDAFVRRAKDLHGG